MFCSALYCVWFALHLYCPRAVYSTLLCCAVLCCALLCCVVLCMQIVYCAVRFGVLLCSVLCCAVLCVRLDVMWCDVILCIDVLYTWPSISCTSAFHLMATRRMTEYSSMPTVPVSWQRARSAPKQTLTLRAVMCNVSSFAASRCTARSLLTSHAVLCCSFASQRSRYG